MYLTHNIGSASALPIIRLCRGNIGFYKSSMQPKAAGRGLYARFVKPEISEAEAYNVFIFFTFFRLQLCDGAVQPYRMAPKRMVYFLRLSPVPFLNLNLFFVLFTWTFKAVHFTCLSLHLLRSILVHMTEEFNKFWSYSCCADFLLLGALDLLVLLFSSFQVLSRVCLRSSSLYSLTSVTTVKKKMSFEEVVPIHRFADFSETEEEEPYGWWTAPCPRTRRYLVLFEQALPFSGLFAAALMLLEFNVWVSFKGKLHSKIISSDMIFSVFFFFFDFFRFEFFP